LRWRSITRDEAIKRYQQLLKMHNLTKQERRDILLKIHQLQQDAGPDSQGFALKVGTSSCRRSTTSGAQSARRVAAAGSQVNFHNNVNATSTSTTART
jgi:hypothetical protein